MKRLLQNSIININAKRLINAVKTTMQRIKKILMLKKTKVKIINDFIVSKKIMNTKTLKKDKINV